MTRFYARRILDVDDAKIYRVINDPQEGSQRIKWCASCRVSFEADVKFCGICGQEVDSRTVTAPFADMMQPEGGSSYLGQTIDNRYLIKRLVGRGGMGTVYEVEHTLMKRRLAMKLLHEDMVVRKQLVSRFTREARAVSRLNSPHTVTVHDFGRYEALFFLVMEYLDGEDLEVVLSREGPLSWQRGFRILAQICESLEEAHEAGIVHRDLKPENIMILFEPEGEDYVKVLDFGLAKISGGEDLFSIHSHRDLFGTPYYMSPEQIRSEDIDHRADVYSLGCLAFRVLTNQHVYDAPYAFDVLRQHLTSPIPSVKRTVPGINIPDRVDRLVRCALAKRMENRFSDVTAMRREILECLDNPEGISSITAGLTSDVPMEIGDELNARLQAFEQSHQVAEARMLDSSESPLPYGEEVEDEEFMPPSPLAAPSYESSTQRVESDSRDSDRQLNVVTAQIPIQKRRRNTAVKMVAVTSRSAIPVAVDPDDVLLDPSEEGRLFNRIRRRRRMRIALMGCLIVAAVGGGWWYLGGAAPVVNGVELEPNDTVGSAMELAGDLEIRGNLGSRISQFQGDRDAFRVSMRGANQLLSLSVGPLEGVDLSIDVLEPDGRRITRLNHAGIGKEETIHNLLIPTEQVVVMVSEYNDGESEPSENTDAYRLRVGIIGEPPKDSELEPNDVWAASNTYVPGAAIRGYLDGPGDVDSFRIVSDHTKKLQRWEFVIESKDRLVPRIELYRLIDETAVLVYADEGRYGLLRTVYEESEPHQAYLLVASHAGRGPDRGQYSLLVDLKKRKERVAHEPNDDRARATSIEIGETVHGALEGS
ncbi:MAG: serine/threonine-protein kinase, partial [Myxococcota bacterium]|nr:serine/threonine-protein kinase [Myxococcota bacterium]